jgi:hypothetical protein
MLIYVKETFGLVDKCPVGSVSLSLNPCSLELDPGLVDRTYILINYAEMDPECLKVGFLLRWERFLAPCI